VQQTERVEGGRADIIWVVDGSGSMVEENAAVQNNLNAFSQFIGGAGIDVHVVLLGGIASDPWSALNGIGVCVAPPLGMPGACPGGDDTNLPAGYLHWANAVGSNNGLQVIQASYSGWRAMLRPDALKTWVVVTDDEATAPPDAATFVSWVNAQPEFQGAKWRFSGIFCVTNSANCAAPGTTWNALVTQTGGLAGDLARFGSGQVDAEFKRVFDTLAQGIVQEATPVDCEWSIPPPPEGQTLDPNQVNVRYTDSSGSTHLLYGLDDASQCQPGTGGWYYNDPANPSRVVACESSCQAMQSDPNARVEVLFGCAREQPPVK